MVSNSTWYYRVVVWNCRYYIEYCRNVYDMGREVLIAEYMHKRYYMIETDCERFLK